ncbi:MAG: hypothetical protein ACK4PI_11670 [Tepidisphaerales bacterium]
MSRPPVQPDPLPDDPALRSLLHGHFAGHRASAALRRRIEELLAAGPAGIHRGDGEPPFDPHAGLDGVAGRLSGDASAWRGAAGRVAVGRRLAAFAAVLVIIAGLGWLSLQGARTLAQRALLADNRPLVDASLALARATELPLVDLVPSNLPSDAISRQLSTLLRRNVVVPDANLKGWTVSTAGVLDFNGQQVGCVVYRNHSRSAMLLAWPATPHLSAGDWFDKQLGDHRVAAVGLRDGVQIWVTAPCKPGEDDGLEDLYGPVLARRFP